MQPLLRFVLIVLALFAVYWFITGDAAIVIPNAGELTMPVGVPEEGAAAPADDSAVAAIPEPVPGAPDSVIGGSMDRLNWDGLGEQQLMGALSKQYQDLTGEDLLPHNDVAHFAEIYPNGTGQLQNKSFLHAGHHIGINTVGQANKNPNLQIRSEPANSTVAVSPWMNSSYGPDLLRRPLEIAGCE